MFEDFTGFPWVEARMNCGKKRTTNGMNQLQFLEIRSGPGKNAPQSAQAFAYAEVLLFAKHRARFRAPKLTHSKIRHPIISPPPRS